MVRLFYHLSHNKTIGYLPYNKINNISRYTCASTKLQKNSDRISGCQRFPIFIDYHHRVVLRQTPSSPLSNGLHVWARLLPYLPAKWQIPTPYYSCNVEVDRPTIHQNRYNSYAQPSANHYAKNPDRPHVHIEKPTELFCAKATSPP